MTKLRCSESHLCYEYCCLSVCLSVCDEVHFGGSVVQHSASRQWIEACRIRTAHTNRANTILKLQVAHVTVQVRAGPVQHLLTYPALHCHLITAQRIGISHPGELVFKYRQRCRYDSDTPLY